MHNDAGQLLTDPDVIRSEWNEYYRELYSEKHNSRYNNDFKMHVESVIEDIKCDYPVSLSGGHVTADDVNEIISNMKLRKAPGFDNITLEHLKYGGGDLQVVISWIINSIIEIEMIPIMLKKGLIIPIPKAGKDHTIKDNNRGITLLPIVYKIMENILIKREGNWFNDNTFSLQSAGISKCSSSHSSLVVQEVVSYCNNLGQTVYGAFLDTRKAFDTVWIKGMLYKCYNKGMNMKLWRLIKNGYDKFSCAVYLDGKNGEWFTPQQGVHQGAPLSMSLYVIYINDLLCLLRASGHGVVIDGQDLTCPAHADDVAILALYKTSLNYLLDIAESYSCKWRYEFNYDKSVVVVFGKDYCPNQELKMGVNTLTIEEKVKHMGVVLCKTNSSKQDDINRRIGKGQSVLNAARGIGSEQIPMPPLVLSKIYWAVAIPKVTYGLDITPINGDCMIELEKFHPKSAKVIQCLPDNIPNPAPLSSIGWMSMRGYIAICQIMFLLRTLSLHEDNSYKVLVLNAIKRFVSARARGLRVKYAGPIANILHTFLEYGLFETFMHCVETKTFGDPNTWKGAVIKVVWERENDRWKATCILYGSLKAYSIIMQNIKIHPWWILTKNKPHLTRYVSSVIALLLGSQPRGLQRNFQNNLCNVCNARCLDTIEHVLFQCHCLKQLRRTWLYTIVSCMPRAMALDFLKLSYKEATELILNGLKCSKYVPEWIDILANICKFVHFMYKRRAELLDDVQPDD